VNGVDGKVKVTMRRIKFVLWERYRAWWGAFQLNEEEPLLLDRMRAEEELKKQEAIKKERPKVSEQDEQRGQVKKPAREELDETQAEKMEIDQVKDEKVAEELQKLGAEGGKADKAT
jgi:hypothetical protein